MKNTDLAIIRQIENNLLPKLGIDKSELSMVITYGSRVFDSNRENSDFDILVVIKSSSSRFIKEYHGKINLLNKDYSVEFRAYSLKSLINEIKNGSMTKTHAILNSKTIRDTYFNLNKIKAVAKTRLAKETKNIKQDILKYRSTQLIKLMQISFTETKSILLCPKTLKQPIYVLSKFSEMIIDFYIYFEYLKLNKILKFSNHSKCIHKRLEALVYICNPRPSRFLNSNRYKSQAWFYDLSENINLHFSKQSNIQSLLNHSFKEMNNLFLKNFNKPLFLENILKVETTLESI